MLHFPSPVKLTGWNATGGLLGRKDEIFFFSSPALLFFIPLPHHLFLTHTTAPSCLFVLFSCLLYVCFYVIGFLCNAASLSLMCWCVGTLPWPVRTVLTHGRCISASWQPSNPVVISVAMSPNSPQLSHYSSVLTASSYMSCVQHLIVGAKNILSHVSSMWYVENLLWSI